MKKLTKITFVSAYLLSMFLFLFNIETAFAIGSESIIFSPADNSQNVSTVSNLEMKFSSKPTPVSGKNIIIKRTLDDTEFESIDATDPKVMVVSNTVIIDPDNKFIDNTQYYVEMETGAIEVDGADVTGWEDDNATWNFKTADWVEDAPVDITKTAMLMVDGGTNHSVGVTADGTVVSWGNTSNANLVVPDGLADVKAVSAGNDFTVALKYDGTVIAWGESGNNRINVPAGLTDVVKISSSGYQTIALKSDGTHVAWGEGVEVVETAETIVDVAASDWQSYLLLENDIPTPDDGIILYWGSEAGREGVRYKDILNVDAVDVGNGTAIALITDTSGNSSVTSWTSSAIVDPIPAITNAIEVSAGAAHSAALLDDGTVRVWGTASGNLLDANAWTDIVAIASGENHLLGIKSDGTVVAAGDDTSGQCSNIPVTHSAFGETESSLSDLSVIGATLEDPFVADENDYTVIINNDVTSIKVQPTVSSSAAIIKVNGTVVNSGEESGDITLDSGSDTIYISVTDMHGIYTKNYSIYVERIPDVLQSLSTNRGTLEPVFDQDTFIYQIDFEPKVSDITITAVPFAGATIDVSGTDSSAAPLSFTKTGDDYTFSGLDRGIYNIYIKVNGDANEYHITVNNHPDISELRPNIENLTPGHDGADSIIGDDLVMDFDKNVSINSGDIVIKESDGTHVETIDITSNQVSKLLDKVTINPSFDFAYSTIYYVDVELGAFSNALSPTATSTFIGGLGAWKFTTEDAPPPEINSLTPSHGSTDIGIDAVLVLDFKENVFENSGNIVIEESDGTPVETIAITSNQVSFSANEVTITPSDDFDYATTYEIEVAAGAVVNLAGGESEAIGASGTWAFTTKDAPLPEINSLTPSHGSTDIGIDAVLVLDYKENVFENSGSIVIEESDGTPVETIAISSNQVSFSANEVTITPSDDFDYATTYEIEVAAGAVVNLAGGESEAIGASGTWAFTTKDAPLPEINSLTPSHGSADIGIDAVLVLDYKENVFENSGNIVIEESDGTPVETIAISSNQVSFSANEVTITPSDDFDYATTYEIEVAEGAVVNLAGGESEAIGASGTWAFTTEDTPLPEINSLTPSHGSTDIGIDAVLVLDFKENVFENSGNIVIEESDGTPVETIAISSNQVSFSANEVTITPSDDFDYATTYEIKVAAGAVVNLAGGESEAIGASGTWAFTTKDAPIPNIQNLTPGHDSTDVSISTVLVLDFDEEVFKNTGSIVIEESDGTPVETIAISSTQVSISTDKVTITPSDDFDYATTYYIKVTVSAFKNALGSGSIFTGGSNAFKFTTKDAPVVDLIPNVISTAPSHGSTNVSINANVVMRFDENITANAKNIVIKKLTGDTLVETISCTSAQVSISADTVTINPSSDFENGTTYYVKVDAGAFSNASGKDSIFTGGSSAFKFTTAPAPTSRPYIISVSPENMSLDNDINEELVIKFNQDVVANDKLISIKRIPGPTIVESINSGSDDVVISGDTVTIKKHKNFSYDTEYYITVQEGAFKNASADSSMAYGGYLAWQFATKIDTTPIPIPDPPQIVSLSPSSGSSMSNSSFNLSLTFTLNDMSALRGSINIFRQNGSTFDTISVPSANVTVSGNSVQIKTSKQFEENEKYYVLIQSGTFTSQEAGEFEGITSPSEWTFEVVDSTRPSIRSKSPASGASGVGLNSPITLSFSEPIKANAKYIYIRELGSNSIVESILCSSIKVKTSGTLVTVNRQNNLEYGKTYYITVDGGAFSDESGNMSAAYSGTSWQFTTLEDPDPDELTEDLELPPTVPEPELKFKLSVRIVDQNGNPVPGVKVELSPSMRRVASNGSGIAGFSGIDLGRHSLILKSWDGRLIKQMEIDVRLADAASGVVKVGNVYRLSVTPRNLVAGFLTRLSDYEIGELVDGSPLTLIDDAIPTLIGEGMIELDIPPGVNISDVSSANAIVEFVDGKIVISYDEGDLVSRGINQITVKLVLDDETEINKTIHFDSINRSFIASYKRMEGWQKLVLSGMILILLTLIIFMVIIIILWRERNDDEDEEQYAFEQ
jgi:methionine-rich copper-binding protein CopC